MVPDYCESLIEAEEPNIIKERLNNFVENPKYPLSIEKDGNKVKIITKVYLPMEVLQKRRKCYLLYDGIFREIMACNCDICEFIQIYNDRISLDITERILDVDSKMMYQES